MAPDSLDDDYESALQAWLPAKPAPSAEKDDDGLGLKAQPSPEDELAQQRVREWMRTRFKLAGDAAILVSEIVCTLPGCPPLETAVAFWEGETRYHFKLFKPVREVALDDLPFAWMKAELVVPEGFNCECC
jgi:nitrate reductase delta subunit